MTIPDKDIPIYFSENIAGSRVRFILYEQSDGSAIVSSDSGNPLLMLAPGQRVDSDGLRIAMGDNE